MERWLKEDGSNIKWTTPNPVGMKFMGLSDK
jgi:hypothetical protein